VIRVIFSASLVVLLSACTLTTNKHVTLQPQHLTCSVDSDCTLARLSCSKCGDPVVKTFAAELEAQTRHICRNYRGPVVDCPPNGSSACQQGQCAFVLTGDGDGE
jgi:hypothetical protein